jgi:hypothetical protein
MEKLRKMHALDSLNLSNNPQVIPTLDDVEILANLNKLKTLSIMNIRRLDKEILRKIIDLPYLEKLSISNQDMLDILNDSTISFESIGPRLKTLELINCGLDFAGFSKIVSRFPNLERLNLSENNMVSFNRDHGCNIDFGNLKETLRHLSMESSNLSSEWLDAIGKCKNLKVLILSDNENVGDLNKIKFCEELADNLEELVLDKCNLNFSSFEKIATEFKGLKILEYLRQFINFKLFIKRSI